MTADLTQPGLRDQVITAELAEVLKELGDQAERVTLTETEIVERLGKHLLQVSRRMKSPSDRSKIAETVDAVNDAIAALGGDPLADRIAQPAELLAGIKPSTGLAQSLPARPHLPLSDSALLVNGHGQPAFGAILRGELDCAVNVDLICAFVGFSGLSALRDNIANVIQRGGTVRVITSTYLGATSAKAVQELTDLGAQVRINYQGHATKLHAKAWYFERGHGIDTAMIGSSNMSDAAFFTGLEWNVRLSQIDSPGVLNRVRSTFDSYWHDSAFELYTAADHERLEEALAHAKGKATGPIAGASTAVNQAAIDLAAAYSVGTLQARPHQQLVLDRLALRRTSFDEHRHLVIAATGTGKTVIAALDYARLCEPGKPRPRLLFVAHREQILKQARATFRLALKDPNFGEILAGGATLNDDAHVFAMVQTLHGRLPQVSSDAFDVVYIDEAHHVTAATWKSVINHFTPQELVGLTATPERIDGGNVADLFGGVFTTELRLWEAISDQLLAPFEYLGIDDHTDLTSVAWHNGAYAVGELSELLTQDDVQFKSVLNAVLKWVESPIEMRALGFCVSKDHAAFMADRFTKSGIPAGYLTGDHSDAERHAMLTQLKNKQLNVVFSVDVLGEGIDVPDVDTLLLLRPTQSSVLFAQQLGRGLRLSPGKSACLVLDFIGQHRKEYKIQERYRALLNPANGSLKEQVGNGFPFLAPGCSITLEKVASERIIAALKATTVGHGEKQLVKDLQALKSPTLADFLKDSGRTLEEFYGADGRKMSWTRLQRAAGVAASTADAELSAAETLLLRRASYFQHVTDPDRAGRWRQWLSEETAPVVEQLTSAEKQAANQLVHVLGTTADSLQSAVDLVWSHDAVREELANLFELTEKNVDALPLVLNGLENVPLRAHARYTRAEVLAAIGASEISKPREHREGVFFHPESRIQLMFVTLHKDTKKFSSTTQYKDHALSPTHFHWESPNAWRQDGAAMQRCLGNGPDGSLHRLLFVREQSQAKEPIESTFRCFGQVDVDGPLVGDRPVSVTWKLRQPLPELLYEAASLLAG